MFRDVLSSYAKELDHHRGWGMKLGWLLGQDDVRKFCKAHPDKWNSLHTINMYDRIRFLRAQLTEEKKIEFDDFVMRIDGAIAMRHQNVDNVSSADQLKEIMPW